MAKAIRDDLLVFDWIADHAARRPHALATIDVHSGRRTTYAHMHERVARIAGYLTSIGIMKGDRVAMLSMNSPDMLDVQFACWRVGACYTPLNFRLTAHELAFMVDDSGAKAFFYDTELAEVIPALRTKTDVAHWIALDPMGGPSDLETIVATAPPRYDFCPQGEDDLCMIMYSSGTTGTPKGVMFHHRQIIYSCAGAVAGLSASDAMVGLVVMPLFHIGGLMAWGLVAANFGGTSVIVRNFDAGKMLGMFNDPALGVTHFLGVPAIFNALQAHEDFAATDFSRMKATMCGAESVPESLLRAWYDRGVTIREGFGMTETAAGCLSLSDCDIPHKIGSAGKPNRFCDAYIARADGSEAESGELGEIWIRGKNVTPGYWNRPDANASAFVDGWFRSGDIGRRDADGYFYIEDRVKDMYISGGENVYPAEIENILFEMSAIHEVAVIGLADPKWGEVGCAVVVPADGAVPTLEDVRAFCGDRLARFKQPARLEIVDELPRNATGKVLKFELRARFG
ncbi:MAG: long-chain fatty acid--CoA ligase [Sphingopyxis sp.]|nr:long-chain fatty acid--CoA ligase [Sphingopyxis sp.]